jgi:hypothetical protein
MHCMHQQQLQGHHVRRGSTQILSAPTTHCTNINASQPCHLACTTIRARADRWRALAAYTHPRQLVTVCCTPQLLVTVCCITAGVS